MKRPIRRPAFVDNELLIVIAVLAIWLAISLPVYARQIEALKRLGKPVGLGQQLLAIGIAAVAPVVVWLVLAGMVWAGEQIWTALRRIRE